MTKLTVAGRKSVAGVEPGGTVDTADLQADNINVEALIEGGHLVAPVSKRKADD